MKKLKSFIKRWWSPSEAVQEWVPKNLDEATDYLIAHTKPDELEYIKTADMADFHFNLGMSMRNDWGLWSGGRLKDWFNSVGIEHPDDMSAIILKAFRRKVLGIPYESADIAKDAKRYQEYWRTTQENFGKTMRLKYTTNEYGEHEMKIEYEE